MMRVTPQLIFALLIAGVGQALAQDPGTVEDKVLPPLEHPDAPSTPAKELFGRKTKPDVDPARSIGFYAHGCLAGAVALPINGPTWQVMRLSRNRNWGHPKLVEFLERLAQNAKKVGWNGLLVGDMSQPRGGPMLTGHASHQVGLDADIWLTPMPDHTLTRAEREEMSAVNMVTEDGLSVDRAHWTARQAGIIQAAAEEPEVERIFVNAAIKKALCETAHGQPWMTKVRAYWGHNYHFHVRIACPAGDTSCQAQEPVPPGDGCDKSLAWWFTDEALHPYVNPNAKPKPPLTLAQLPPECRQVVLEK